VTTAFENGELVQVVGPDIYRDEPDTEPARDMDSMTALLSVVFSLGQWSGQCPIKEFAARTVMRQTTQSTANYARENGVSDSFVRRRIREAQALIGSAREG